MSLTSVLQERDVREKFKEQFIKPKIKLRKEILAPPRTQRYSLVGTAFDYLFRFYIKYHNPQAIERQWVADIAAQVSIPDGNFGHFEIQQILERAHAIYADYLATGEMIDEVLEVVLLLAQLDLVYRVGRLDEDLGNVDKEDIADLRALISLVHPDTFKAKTICLLNPTFGEASQLVGGADADLVIDDLLLEIKTTKKLDLSLDHFLQLVGYYVLYRIGSMNNAPQQLAIQRLGVYFSRYGELCIIPVADVVDEARLGPFIEWFLQRMRGKS